METAKSTDGTLIAYDRARSGPVLILGGGNSPAWFRRSVAEQAAAIPGGRLLTLDGFDHNAPPEVLAPVLAEFFPAG